MAGLRFVASSVGMAELLRSPDGPLFRWQIENGELVKREAMRLAPVGTVQPGQSRSRPPGTLRDSIVKRVRDSPEGPVVEVGTDDPVGLYMHEGTEPHAIEGNPLLVFYWPKLGKVIAVPRVNHPGTKPNRFLLNALEILRGRI